MKKEKIKKKELERNSGITLIALIITIIVLLILAGVAIATLTGDSGILSNSENAKENTQKANAKEKVQIAIMEYKIGKYTDKKPLKEYLESAGATNVTEDGKEGQMDGYNFKIEDGVVTLTKGEYTPPPPTTSNLTEEEKTALTENGIKELTKEEIETLPNGTELINNENVKAVLTGGVVIPKEFTYVEGTKETGVVVSITTNNVKSEFVWVPVEDVNNMAKLQEGTTGNYEGKLYTDWTETSSTPFTYTNYGVGKGGHREPSLITNNSEDLSAVQETIAGSSYDAASSLYAEGGTFSEYFTDAKAFGQAMQDDYDNMVKSVIKYKGFYVGRYETSLNGTTVASTTGTTTTRLMSGINWYEMYKLQREFCNSSENLNSIKSSMIWGSQYDAMLNWIIDTETQAYKIVEIRNAPHNLEESYRPGSQENDVINNIYDLEGNLREWTLEAADKMMRVGRGGYYYNGSNPSARYNDGFVCYPTKVNNSFGSRTTFYII